MSLTIAWKTAAPLVSLKGISRHSKWPSRLLNAVFYLTLLVAQMLECSVSEWKKAPFTGSDIVEATIINAGVKWHFLLYNRIKKTQPQQRRRGMHQFRRQQLTNVLFFHLPLIKIVKLENGVPGSRSTVQLYRWCRRRKNACCLEKSLAM